MNCLPGGSQPWERRRWAFPADLHKLKCTSHAVHVCQYCNEYAIFPTITRIEPFHSVRTRPNSPDTAHGAGAVLHSSMWLSRPPVNAPEPAAQKDAELGTIYSLPTRSFDSVESARMGCHFFTSTSSLTSRRLLGRSEKAAPHLPDGPQLAKPILSVHHKVTHVTRISCIAFRRCLCRRYLFNA